jgi:hypothetical protein
LWNHGKRTVKKTTLLLALELHGLPLAELTERKWLPSFSLNHPLSV